MLCIIYFLFVFSDVLTKA